MGPALLGRERTLQEVRAAVESSHLVVLHPPVKTTLGSVNAGKSALAAETAWKLYEAGRFDFVFWLTGETQAALESNLAALARKDGLALTPDEVADFRVRLAAMRKWLADPAHDDRYLVVFDGIDRESTSWAVHSMLHWFSRGRIVVTSRLPFRWADAVAVSIAPVATEAAVEMLAHAAHPRTPAGPAERALLAQIAEAVGRQPAALKLAGLLIAGGYFPPQQILAQIGAAADAPASGAATQTPYAQWQIIFGKLVRMALSKADREMRRLLEILACMAPEPAVIPVGIFSGRSDVTEMRGALGRLEHLGLVRLLDGEQTIAISPAVRETVRDRIAPAEIAAALDAARALIEASLPKSERGLAGAVLRERLVPHCRVLLAQLNGHPLEVHATHLARGLAAWLRDCRRLPEAEHFQRRALTISERACEPDHPDLLPDLRALAALLQETHRFAEAEALRRRALAISEKLNGPSSKDLVPDLSGLAACLRVAGDFDAAEQVLRRVLEIEERSSGPSHPRTALAAHALGGLLEIAGRPAEALPLYRRALNIDEHAPLLGAQRLAVRHHNLACALAGCGKVQDAIAEHQRGLLLDESTFGKDALELAPILQQMAALHLQLGSDAEAEMLLRRAIAIEKKHAATVEFEYGTSLAALVEMLLRQGRVEEARPFAKQVQEIATHLAGTRLSKLPAIATMAAIAAKALDTPANTTRGPDEARAPEIVR
jgi:tetratricopeptide (TPR) repeat protein